MLSSFGAPISGDMSFHDQDNSRITQDFLKLDVGDNHLVEYVWIDGTGVNTRSKTRVINKPINSVADLPVWNYDGSSCQQASREDSEILLKPCKLYRHPFHPGAHYLVMCEALKLDGSPAVGNYRHDAERIFDECKDEHPWFGIEQEYTLFTMQNHPLGWPSGGFPAPQGPYYCGVGASSVFGREVVVAHLHACLYAGVKIGGTNAEVMPGQWEFQVGPCEGIDVGDDLWMARFILARLGENYRAAVSYDPKPIPGDWNGAGAHCNFSTASMRAPNGIKVIQEAINALSKNHMEHIAVYGQGNERRLTGDHETSAITDFSAGVGNRGCSVRIPRATEEAGCGYLEDRRPASNADPYAVASKIAETTVLRKRELSGMAFESQVAVAKAKVETQVMTDIEGGLISESECTH